METPLNNGDLVGKDPVTGRFVKGHKFGKGRPKGSFSFKDLIRKRLQENPKELNEIIAYFVKENRELLWQMLEGRPPQHTDEDHHFPDNLADIFKHAQTNREEGLVA